MSTDRMFREADMHDGDVFEELRRLRTENEDLRRASECFGQLAERLNRQLIAERRLRADSDYKPQAVPVATARQERVP